MQLQLESKKQKFAVCKLRGFQIKQTKIHGENNNISILGLMVKNEKQNNLMNVMLLYNKKIFHAIET